MIGEFKESLFIDTRVWSIDSYLKHWNHTFNNLNMGSDHEIICVSLDNRWMNIWPVDRLGPEYKLCNLIYRREDFEIDSSYEIRTSQTGEPLPGPDETDMSRWVVPVEPISPVSLG